MTELENRMSRKLFGPKKMKYHEAEENYIKRSFMIFSLHQEIRLRRTRSAGQVAHVGTIKMHIRFWLRKPGKKKRPH
jgi:hypothetical protein